jgi:hypothetical protein
LGVRNPVLRPIYGPLVHGVPLSIASRVTCALNLPDQDGQVLGVGLKCSESTGVRGHRAAGREPEACGVTTIPPALALLFPVAALLYVLALAPTAEPSPAPENFFQKTPFTERLPRCWGRNRFWTVFWERGHEQFSESNSPPYRGVASAARTSSSFEMRQTVPVPTRGAGDGRQSTLIAPEVAEPVG